MGGHWPKDIQRQYAGLFGHATTFIALPGEICSGLPPCGRRGISWACEEGAGKWGSPQQVHFAISPSRAASGAPRTSSRSPFAKSSHGQSNGWTWHPGGGIRAMRRARGVKNPVSVVAHAGADDEIRGGSPAFSRNEEKNPARQHPSMGPEACFNLLDFQPPRRVGSCPPLSRCFAVPLPCCSVRGFITPLQNPVGVPGTNLKTFIGF
jgi:hypothetical protein